MVSTTFYFLEQGLESCSPRLPPRVPFWGSSSLRDPLAPRAPRLVLVGGGFSGSKLAQLLDSLFDVTLIDTKNYVDFTPDVVSVVAQPWTPSTETFLQDNLVLHRFFLKHANVLLNRVVRVDPQRVVLADGSTVEFDVLVLATGRRKAFPFGTTVRHKTERIAELKTFSEFINSSTTRRLAVIGAGPLGCSLAHSLARNYPDKHIDLYAASHQPVPRLLPATQHFVRTKLGEPSNLHLQWSTVVDTCEPTHLRRWSMGRDSLPGFILRGCRHLGDDTEASQLRRSKGSAPARRSLLHQLYFGAASTLQVERGRHASQSDGPFGDSNAYQYFTSPTKAPAATASTKSNTHAQSSDLGPTGRWSCAEPYDYVFHCTGSVPHLLEQDASPLPSTRSEAVSPPGTEGSAPWSLASHRNQAGLLRVSRYMQLYGYPHMFAIGTCSALPSGEPTDTVVSYAACDAQAQTLFRLFHKVLTSHPASVPLFNDERSGGMRPWSGKKQRLFSRGVLMPIGKDHEAFGATPWEGEVSGFRGYQEWVLQRRQLWHSFQNPVFYKRRDAESIRAAFDSWKAREKTDVKDFSF